MTPYTPAATAMDAQSNLRGSLWMIAAMAFFAFEDTVIKTASATIPVGQVLIVFGLGGAIVFAALARAGGQPLFTRDVLAPAMRIRVVFEVTGRLFYILAIALIPLSAATVILQATPLVVVAGAALVFGERVGWQRWAAIPIGLSGVLLILQPGTESFTLPSVLAVIGMIGFAGRDLASRAAPATLGTQVLGFYGFVAVTIAGTAFALWQGAAFVVPGRTAAACLAAAVVVGVAAYACLMKAMRTGDVSAVTPFRYTRLLFGVALGVLIFDEALTPATLAGSGLIVLSGLLIRLRRRAA
ncbi:EamA-like transporter family protein [Loktanella fryxellensis]|uniref:EamA-like transporter family protein n=2 Tax=Loktanella fryxellensis TaxID=245187 RepID=A0A1H8EBM3_9RHOB|nr:EamA-like transporter family protein [Loktanella fryxellensis]